MSGLVFLDTETTGLSLDDDIWEFAAIRRETDGTETRLHLFIEHAGRKCARLPDAFREDHNARFHPSRAVLPSNAARQIANLLHDRPHVVGAVPNFDTERLAILLHRYHYEPMWHYHLIDVENLAVGYLHGRAHRDDEIIGAVALPWDSDELSRQCGVEPPSEGERHTAMGDAEWAMRLYDAIVGGAS